MLLFSFAKDCYVIMDCYDSREAFQDFIHLHLKCVLAAFCSHWHWEVSVSPFGQYWVEGCFQTGFVVEETCKESLVGINFGEPTEEITKFIKRDILINSLNYYEVKKWATQQKVDGITVLWGVRSTAGLFPCEGMTITNKILSSQHLGNTVLTVFLACGTSSTLHSQCMNTMCNKYTF